MKLLNLPAYTFKIKHPKKGGSIIFDVFRNKYVALTPEEWVRQHFLMYLTEDLHYPRGLVSVEQTISFNAINRRCDAVVYKKNGQPVVMIECKAYDEGINQKTFDQISRYATSLKVPYLFITNGAIHYALEIYEDGDYKFLNRVPYYDRVIDDDIYPSYF